MTNPKDPTPTEKLAEALASSDYAWSRFHEAMQDVARELVRAMEDNPPSESDDETP